MNPFQRLGVKISNWWRGEPQDSGGVVTLNSPSFLERIGLKRKGKPTSEVTYFTCLKMLSETLAKMPIKYYQKTDKGIIEAEATDTSKLLSKRPNPFMTPTTFWNTVEINRNHYGKGNRWTPCRLTITALEYIETMKINGLSDEITIKTIPRGATVVIDGETGFVTMDGENKFKDVEMFEFPYLKTGKDKEHHIIFSDKNAIVTIQYKPMWL